MLKIYHPEELLVGVMWSGRDRLEFYKKDMDDTIVPKFVEGTPYYTNPQWIAGKPHYYLINFHWDDEITTSYCKNFYSDEWASILSYEHILRTEWFLKSKNIKYFMTGYGGDVFPHEYIMNDPDISYLHNLIDWDNWLEINNMDLWAQNTGLPYRKIDDHHPSTEMHKLFVDTVILPHLKKKGYYNGNS